MELSHFGRYALTLTILAASAGCNGQSGSNAPSALVPSTTTAARHVASWISPEAKRAKELLYVADPTQNPSSSGHIDIFEMHGATANYVGSILDPEDPNGMTTDKEGNLYVTDLGVATEGPAAGDIKVYPKGSTSYSRLIVPGDWVPFDIAVNPNGTLYVANIAPVGYFNPGSVSVFPPNASQPSRVLTLKNFQVDGITRHDQTSTVYISFQANGGDGEIAEFKHARGKAINLGVSFPEPWGLLEDGNDNLLAAVGSGSINVYSEATKQLVQQISVPNGAMWEAFNQKRTHLFVSNFEQVEILNYPAGQVIGTVNHNYSTSNYPTGVAVWPPPP
jgi:sugar lactone lactonase YvrE